MMNLFLSLSRCGTVVLIALSVIVVLTLGSDIYKLQVEFGRRASVVGPLPSTARSGLAEVPYVPAPVEDYIVQNARALGYATSGASNAKGCPLWTDRTASPIYNDLHTFQKELSEYNRLLQNFTSIPDLRLSMDGGNDDNHHHTICNTVELHPDGLGGIFKSGQLSLSSAGYVEPLFPPMRHPGFCFERQKYLMDLSYIVHDFGAMCRKLKRTSRIVLLDMGASLDFHGGGSMPAVYLMQLYRKFGFPFDHIYAFEVTKKDPAKVFQLVPQELMSAYHWINVGVNPEPGHPLNPLDMIANDFNEDDFIVIKLDVDHNSIELPLAQQLLNDDRFGPLVDQFYFEHHVHLEEIAANWRQSMEGSVKDTLDLFSGLRQRGIPAHFWV